MSSLPSLGLPFNVLCRAVFKNHGQHSCYTGACWGKKRAMEGTACGHLAVKSNHPEILSNKTEPKIISLWMVSKVLDEARIPADTPHSGN